MPEQKLLQLNLLSMLKSMQGLTAMCWWLKKGLYFWRHIRIGKYWGYYQKHIGSKFQLASLSKTFTAVATMKMVEEGQMGLDNTVKDYFPDFPYDGVTIRSLLSHRSGLPYYQYEFDKKVRDEKYIRLTRCWWPGLPKLNLHLSLSIYLIIFLL